MKRPPNRDLGMLDLGHIQQRAAQAIAGSNASSGGDDDHGRLIAEFEAVLAEDLDLTAEERETVLRQYADALKHTPSQLGAPDVAGLKQSFAAAIDAMMADNSIVSAEREGLQAQFDEALRALDSDDVRRANEYARRLAQDGPEKAAAWLATQSMQSNKAVSAPAAPLPPALAGKRPAGTATPRRRRV